MKETLKPFNKIDFFYPLASLLDEVSGVDPVSVEARDLLNWKQELDYENRKIIIVNNFCCKEG